MTEVDVMIWQRWIWLYEGDECDCKHLHLNSESFQAEKHKNEPDCSMSRAERDIAFSTESLHEPQGQKSHDYSSGKIVYKGLAEAM